MRIVLLGDMQLIDPNHPSVGWVDRRRVYVNTWPSFKNLVSLVKEQGPDLIVSLGDLVDWYDTVNRDYAMGLMSEFDCPWIMTPGNHDLETIDLSSLEVITASEGRSVAEGGWRKGGVVLENRVLSLGPCRFLLIDSASGGAVSGTKDWLQQLPVTSNKTIVLTHIPIDTPEVRKFILDQDPAREIQKYVQGGTAEILKVFNKQNVSEIYSGHLHFPGVIPTGRMIQNLLGLGVSVRRKGVRLPGSGSVTVWDLEKPAGKKILFS